MKADKMFTDVSTHKFEDPGKNSNMVWHGQLSYNCKLLQGSKTCKNTGVCFFKKVILNRISMDWMAVRWTLNLL